MDLEVLLSRLWDQGGGALQAGSRAALRSAFPQITSGLEFLGGLHTPYDPFKTTPEEEETRKAALEAIRKAAEQRQQETVMAQEAESREDDLQKLIERGRQASGQRQFLGESAPLYEDYDKGIAVGTAPGRDAAETLRKIRAQALEKGGGTRGAGGGTLSIAPDSPEIQQRLAARDEWLAQQPMRDAMFESDIARQRRDLPGQELAANKILKLKEQGIIDKRQAVVDRLVQSLGDGTGKIPFEKAMQLEMAGIDIPYQARGISREQALTGLDNEIAALQSELSNIASKGQNFQATEMDQLEYQFGMSALAKMQMYRNMVAQGRMTPDEAAQAIQQTIRDRARELQGVLQYSAPQVIGEAPGVE